MTTPQSLTCLEKQCSPPQPYKLCYASPTDNNGQNKECAYGDILVGYIENNDGSTSRYCQKIMPPLDQNGIPLPPYTGLPVNFVKCPDALYNQIPWNIDSRTDVVKLI